MKKFDKSDLEDDVNACLEHANEILSEISQETDPVCRSMLSTGAINVLGFLANHAATVPRSIGSDYQDTVQKLFDFLEEQNHPNSLKEYGSAKAISPYFKIRIPEQLKDSFLEPEAGI